MPLEEYQRMADTPVSPLPEPLEQWAGVASSYPSNRTVARLFEEVCSAQPNSIAVESGSEQLTYIQLNSRANQLARQLIRQGVGREVLVGVCLERSLDLIVALLAVVKAGGAYVPFDSTYPRERLDFMLADTKTPVMLTQKSLASVAAGAPGVSTILMEELSGDESDEDFSVANSSASDLAYVMYTSGSTGRPKGVLVENRSIVRLVRNTNYCQFGPEVVFLQASPVSFDASTFEIWGALLNGGKLVLMPSGAFSLSSLGSTIRDHGVTTLWLTSGLFNLFVEERLEDLRPIRQLLAGGDVLSTRHVRRVLESLPQTTLINGYGPTEGTTFTCCHVIRLEDLVSGSVPIGRPIAGTFVYILDEERLPVPVGAVGELWAAGDGVARGYLNVPELTTSRFFADPFGKVPGGRMYRTGDLARWRHDGCIEFLGRIDDQVKILGHRIEPGEVESALAGHAGVKQVCMAVKTTENDVKQLVAYYVPASNPPVSPRELKEFLSAKLPEYMVPSFFVRVKEFRLNSNGKIDRSSLPATTVAEEHVLDSAAGNPIERAISNEWKRVLRIDSIGLDDNFFDLGGNSLQLVAIHLRLEQELKKELEITDLFEFTTVRSLAKHLAGQGEKATAFAAVQNQAAKQRDAFSRMRNARGAKP